MIFNRDFSIHYFLFSSQLALMKKYQEPCGLYIQSLARTSNIRIKRLDDQHLGLTLEATGGFLHTPLQKQSPSKSINFCGGSIFIFLHDIYATKHDVISVHIRNQTKLRLSRHCWEVIHYLMETPLLMIQAVEQIILQEATYLRMLRLLKELNKMQLISSLMLLHNFNLSTM